MKKILFGAGILGIGAISEYGRENVAYLVDNNPQKIGRSIEGIPVISFEKLKQIYNDYEIVITTKYSTQIEKDLREAGILNFSHYYEGKKTKFYKTRELIINPYLESRESSSFWENSEEAKQIKINEVNIQVERLYEKEKLEIQYIEIETINRCNGTCSFCPINRKMDSRKLTKMSNELFVKIIDELAQKEYKNKIALYSNNEPFLDEEILWKHKYVRSKLPNADMFLFTNGTLLTIDKFVEVMKYLDELVIDNYHQELELIKPCKEIVAYCETHPEYKDKVTIVLRKPNEILSSRGGDAPNKKDLLKSYENAKCTHPFKRMIIRPTGEISLCCNDPLGKYTLGDLRKNTIQEIWNGEQYKKIREALYNGRGNIEQCRYCDMFTV